MPTIARPSYQAQERPMPTIARPSLPSPGAPDFAIDRPETCLYTKGQRGPKLCVCVCVWRCRTFSPLHLSSLLYVPPCLHLL